jgi:hypothetical protein
MKHACEHGEFEVAEQLTRVLEMIINRGPPDQVGHRRQRDKETLVATYGWLWQQRRRIDSSGR